MLHFCSNMDFQAKIFPQEKGKIKQVSNQLAKFTFNISFISKLILLQPKTELTVHNKLFYIYTHFKLQGIKFILADSVKQNLSCIH